MPAFRNLYVHFPYCETKCHYCDFFSLPEPKTAPNDRARVYDAILRERSLIKLEALETVFLGGGTPSLVPLKVMAALMRTLPLTPSTEVTMEANPSSVTLERAREWRRMGVNRISLGTQALEDARLKWLGRVHNTAGIHAALDALIKGGFENVNIDYILGAPGQAVAQIRAELTQTLRRHPDVCHVSAYLLTLKSSNSKFNELPPEEAQLEHLRTARETLLGLGFEHYEISNFARPGRRALHNENYWLGGSYAGIGPGAHSFRGASLGTPRRAKNWASLSKYCEEIDQGRAPREWEEDLSSEQERIEYLMLHLRRAEGVNPQDYARRFGKDLLSERGNWIEILEKKGLCSFSPGDERSAARLRLTADGFFLSDQVIEKFL
ncbi:MAG: radical SAM family heme chaperone HemW [Deltaproteobacteria bacterium]|nr:radical SAM family heme chaperone HemW [Deltaproteobacteria bacterium]